MNFIYIYQIYIYLQFVLKLILPHLDVHLSHIDLDINLPKYYMEYIYIGLNLDFNSRLGRLNKKFNT